MHKFRKLLFLFPLSLIATSLASCDPGEPKRVLRVLNCEDYIYEYEPDEDLDADMKELGVKNYKKDVMDQFVDHYKKNFGEEIEYVYDTFDTNETMFNELKTGKTTYDVVVPSDYMIQKLRDNKMLHKISLENEVEMWKNISPYLKDKFENSLEISDYAVPYMWGTVGLMYNPQYYMKRNSKLKIEDVHKLFENWDNLYTNKDIRGTFSIKDSVRDTYAVSLIHAFSDKIEKTTDPDVLEKFFNQHDKNTMEKVKKDMLALKEAAFGFECDSGKTDMVDQKVGANMCWSGDATWAISEAEEKAKVELYYSVPINGGKSASNIWFDGFCMPKTAKDEKHLTKEEKAQYALAEEFIKFMSRPDIAMLNCYSVGYTPAVAGEEMMDYMLWYYGVEDGEPSIEYDLSYFYDGTLSDTYKTANGFTSKIYINADPDTAKRDLAAQYPTEEILPRLAVMKNFPEEDNIALLDMWEQVRTNPLPTWGVIVLVCEGAAALAFAIYLVSHKVNRKRFKKERHVN